MTQPEEIPFKELPLEEQVRQLHGELIACQMILGNDLTASKRLAVLNFLESPNADTNQFDAPLDGMMVNLSDGETVGFIRGVRAIAQGLHVKIPPPKDDC